VAEFVAHFTFENKHFNYKVNLVKMIFRNS